ncbi:hypothetical protein AB0L05_16075 [Nonomuraea pusilla]|uniref:hypothetical protein n=1 Tax=Nonomuraea pusilla TaxID=46177 RepID=UPI00332FEF49
MTMPTWYPHQRRSPRPLRVREWSCCDEYQLCSEAGQYFILRRAADGGYEETSRGIYTRTRAVWDELIAELARSHRPPTP